MILNDLKMAGMGLAVILIFGAGYTLGKRDGDIKVSRMEAKQAKADAEAAERAAQAAEDAQNTLVAAVKAQRLRDAQEAQKAQDAEDQAAKDYEKEKTRYEGIISGLQLGAIRLQQRFKCPSAAVPNTGADTRGPDNPNAGGLQDADGRFLIREADRADSVVLKFNRCAARLSQIAAQFRSSD